LTLYKNLSLIPKLPSRGLQYWWYTQFWAGLLWPRPYTYTELEIRANKLM